MGVAALFIWFWLDIKSREREALLHEQEQRKERERLEALYRNKKSVRVPSRIPSARVVPIRKPIAKAPIRTGVIQADPPTISPAPAASISSDDTAAVIGLVALGVALYDAVNDDRPSTASSTIDDDNTPFASGGGGDFGGGGADSSWSDSSSDSSNDSF